MFTSVTIQICSQDESEAEGRSPVKKVARSPSVDSLDSDSISFGSSAVTSTQVKVSPYTLNTKHHLHKVYKELCQIQVFVFEGQCSLGFSVCVCVYLCLYFSKL